MRTNTQNRVRIETHEGGKAKHINPEQQLRRSIMACLLWENTFYEDGVEVTDRIKELIPQVVPGKVADMVIEAREKMKLRHVPLFIVREMARHNTYKGLVANTLARVIQRADELTEFLSLYWKDGKCPISAQVKKGLGRAFTKFNAYDLAKYNREDPVKLRDVLFLSYPKSKDDTQKETWKKLVDGTLEPPDTWEVSLSAGADKKATWERLIQEGKLGALAFLRNLRNMAQVGVDEKVVFSGMDKLKIDRVLPFRFITAARYVPQWEIKLESLMMRCLSTEEKLGGKTILVVDVSGSMDQALSSKSETTRLDTACGLAVLLREVCEDISIYSFSNIDVVIPDRHGFALRDAITNSQSHNGTHLGGALKAIQTDHPVYDRLIVITDEQAHDDIPDSTGLGYVLNVGTYKNGIGYGKWLHIDGWSESVIDYIRAYEKEKGE